VADADLAKNVLMFIFQSSGDIHSRRILYCDSILKEKIKISMASQYFVIYLKYCK